MVLDGTHPTFTQVPPIKPWPISATPGWKADAAIQGLGRTNRTNQAQPPLFEL